MIEYPGSAIGYQLFEQDPSLEPRIVAWLVGGAGMSVVARSTRSRPATGGRSADSCARRPRQAPRRRRRCWPCRARATTRDAWTHVAMALAERGLHVLQIDIRGRGASTNGVRYSEMGPAQRRRVSLDCRGRGRRARAVDWCRCAPRSACSSSTTPPPTRSRPLPATSGSRAIAVLSARHAGRVADGGRRAWRAGLRDGVGRGPRGPAGDGRRLPGGARGAQPDRRVPRARRRHHDGVGAPVRAPGGTPDRGAPRRLDGGACWAPAVSRPSPPSEARSDGSTRPRTPSAACA